MHQGDVFLLTKGLSGRGTAKELLEPPGAGAAWCTPCPALPLGRGKRLLLLPAAGYKPQKTSFSEDRVVFQCRDLAAPGGRQK